MIAGEEGEEDLSGGGNIFAFLSVPNWGSIGQQESG